MPHLAAVSNLVAEELRRAEASINVATRDTAQFLITTLDATATQGLSAAMTYSVVKASVDALSSLVESQGRMAMRAHLSIEKVGRALGLDETSWGEGAPKPDATGYQTSVNLNATVP
ncbi:hypothetical protein [Sphingomonas sp. Leaf242]|uniref:hypothetical protein n=1 Tax=Sphingomonas sp. Leaf242 TaxID=1736304 RepID=UPI0007144089|nr:hypothetical protein [Sphingomonas sp. Leaf242]KQO12198.1 hypothetical protein ASF09_19265 [Sphingomonas sp. Leaf242]